MNDFPSRLRAARLALDISQLELALRAGFSVQGISRFENGRSLPSYSVLCSIIRELNVSADYLMGFTDTPERVEQTM